MLREQLRALDADAQHRVPAEYDMDADFDDF